MLELDDVATSGWCRANDIFRIYEALDTIVSQQEAAFLFLRKPPDPATHF